MTAPKWGGGSVLMQLGSNLNRDPLATWSPKVVKSPHPVDYSVPNFGVDRDVIETQKHITDQEAKHGAWDVLKPKPAAIKRDYAVPNFGVDSDIVNTQKHIADQEASQKHVLGTK